MRALRKRTYRKQLTLVLLMSSIVPLLILSVFSIVFINRSSVDDMNARLNEVLLSSEELITQTLSIQKKEVVMLGDGLVRLMQDSEGEFKQYQDDIRLMMFQTMLSSRATQDMYFVLPNGDYVGTNALPKRYNLPTFSNWGIFREVNDIHGPLMYPNSSSDSVEDNVAYSVIYKVEDRHNLYGYLILDVTTEHIQSLVNTVKGTSFGYVQFILTTQGDRVIYNDSIFRSPISYLSNIFRYDRIAESSNQDDAMKLKDMVIGTRTNTKEGITFYGMVPKDMLYDQELYLIYGIMAFIAVTGLVAFVLVYQTSHRITQPLIDLVDKMRDYMPNETQESLESTANEFEELANQFDDLILRVETAMYVNQQKQELLRIAEIKSLMAQLNPHFLNNTLDSIKWKAKMYGDEDIAMMVTELSVLLKVSMNTEPFVSVAQELDFIDSYVAIQKERYGDKIAYNRFIEDDVYDLVIPKLILQPIVENAIVHGIEPLEGKGRINIYAWTYDGHLYFEVNDNGAGTDFSLPDEDSGKSSSIGLRNVDSRLRLHYGSEYGLQWNSYIGVGTQVLITIPLDGKGDIHA